MFCVPAPGNGLQSGSAVTARFMVSVLTPDILVKAYCMGVFPMGSDNGDIHWYSPDPRCIIDLETFHISKRLARTYRRNIFEMRVNSAWDEVIRQCAQRSTTWINDEIMRAYTELNRLGLAHSVEAYADGLLAGGLYGVSIGGAFMGESMFHRARDASKVCLVYLVERLKERGYVLLDCQYATDHLRQFGAHLISRDEYLIRLHGALRRDCRFD